MANVARPRQPSATERRTRLTLSPGLAPPEDAPSISTRRPSKANTLLAVAPTPAPSPSTAAAAPAARPNARKRPPPATALGATTPPTKIAVTQPHGELLRFTNGVSAPLGIDDVASARATPPPGADKRSLRSHDGGSRLKSDLATYFSSYDDIIAGVPKPAELLDYHTPICIVDKPVSPPLSRPSLSPTRSRKRKASSPAPAASTSSIPPAQSSTAFHALDYASSHSALPNDADADPLADAVFLVQHRRAERKEKQLRNIEKERAMHEKAQLERLLDGLQGPDWLKVMGITGVTDGDRKDWEPKRDFFVKEVEALVDKFRVWKEEEKRLRAEKEAALAAQEDDDDDDDEEGEESDASATPAPNVRHEQQSSKPKTPVPRRPPRPHGFLLPLIPPEPTVPFQSFYSKPHLRAAALGKHRHGRNATAFGLPIPHFDEREFEVPDEFVDPQFLRDNARRKRRRKRESKADEKKE